MCNCSTPVFLYFRMWVTDRTRPTEFDSLNAAIDSRGK